MGKVDQVAEILVNQRDKEAEQAGKSMNTNLVRICLVFEVYV